MINNIDKLLQHTVNATKDTKDIKKMSCADLFLPYVGECYSTKDRPTYLLVMESHFLPKVFDNKLKDISKVYNYEKSYYEFLVENSEVNSECDLKSALEHCYSAKIFSEVIQKAKSALTERHSFRKSINNLMKQANIDIDVIEKQFAIMNYYQRPALSSGDSIKSDDYDNKVAYDNLITIMNLLKPDYIIFASIKAGSTFYHAKKEEGTLKETDNFFKEKNVYIIKHLADARIANAEYSRVYKEWYKKLYYQEGAEEIISSKDLLAYIFTNEISKF